MSVYTHVLLTTVSLLMYHILMADAPCARGQHVAGVCCSAADHLPWPACLSEVHHKLLQISCNSWELQCPSALAYMLSDLQHELPQVSCIAWERTAHRVTVMCMPCVKSHTCAELLCRHHNSAQHAASQCICCSKSHLCSLLHFSSQATPQLHVAK